MVQFRNAFERAAASGSEAKAQELRPQELHPLGAFENVFAAYNEEAITTFTLMAELEGEITKIAIERALAEVQARHPLLAVGIGRGANGRRVFLRSAQPITGPIVLASMQDEHVIGAATLEEQLQLTYASITPLPGLLQRLEKKVVEACAGW